MSLLDEKTIIYHDDMALPYKAPSAVKAKIKSTISSPKTTTVAGKVNTSSKIFLTGSILLGYLLDVTALQLVGFSCLWSCVIPLAFIAVFGLIILLTCFLFKFFTNKNGPRNLFILMCILVILALGTYSTLKQESNAMNGVTKNAQIPDYFFATWQTQVKKACITSYERNEKLMETWLSDMSASCENEHEKHPGSLLSEWCTNTFEKAPLPAVHEKPLPTSFTAWCTTAFADGKNTTTTSNEDGIDRFIDSLTRTPVPV